MADESPEAILALYDQHAAQWAGERGDVLVERVWLDRFLEAMTPGAHVLDLGCGTGRPVARHLREQGCRVTGIDSSPAMIALCREADPGGDWQVADMRGLSLGKTFDGIIAWCSFFHLAPDDQRAMFRVFAEHAQPGAALMFTSGPAAGIAMGRMWDRPVYHASLDPAEYRALLAQNGFRVLRHVAEDRECCGFTVWLACRDQVP